jgi:hypothetical protein
VVVKDAAFSLEVHLSPSRFCRFTPTFEAVK